MSALPARIRPGIAALRGSRIREVANAGIGKPGVIAMWFGESDLPTPDFVREAAADALRRGETFYTPNAGVPELRSAISRYMTRIYGRAIDQSRITVSASGMNAIMIALQALVDAGDNVVLVGPMWPNAADCVRVLGGEARFANLDPGNQGWRLDLDRLEALCDSRTRAIFVNSPGNPTGWMMETAEQQRLLDFARSRGLWIVADEVYARIVYDREVAPSFITVARPDDAVIVINSFSKAWCMTGWRLGWFTAPAALGPTLEKLTEFNIAGPTSFAQWGGIAALEQGEGFIAAQRARLAQSRALVIERLARFRRVRFTPPAAAFYAFFAVEGLTDSVAACKRILNETGVGLAPGAAFGDAGEGHIRMCYAISPERVAEALDRLEPVLG
jgi:aspartate/methionine/tyrosine aminotransferase